MGQSLRVSDTSRAAIAVAFAGSVVLGLLLAVGALAVADDRVVPCGMVRGLDALIHDGAHVDGPEGGGGCIVPTRNAWAFAVVFAVVPPVALVAPLGRDDDA